MKTKSIAKMIAAVLAVTSLAIPTVSQADEETSEASTTALREKLYYNTSTEGYSSSTWQTPFLTPRIYGVGKAGNYLDYDYWNTFKLSGSSVTVNINDNTLTEEELEPRTEITGGGILTGTSGVRNGETLYSNPSSAPLMIDPATGWGYIGWQTQWNAKYYGNNGAGAAPAAGQYDPALDYNPYLSGVLNAREYADDASVAFKINAEGQNLEGVYLTVGYFKDFWDLGWYWDSASGFSYNSKYVDKTDLESIAKLNTAVQGTTKIAWYKDNSTYRTVRFAGVPLADYYDTALGGDQIITVPFEAFKYDNAEFHKMAGKGENPLSASDHTIEFNPGMIKTIGIARTDSGADVNFKAIVKDIAVVAPRPATQLTAAKQSATTVRLSWINSSDIDTASALYREVNGGAPEKVCDITGTTYVDTIAADDEVKYYIVTTDTTYGASAVSEAVMYNVPETADPYYYAFRTMNSQWGGDASVYTFGVGANTGTEANPSFDIGANSEYPKNWYWKPYLNDNGAKTDESRDGVHRINSELGWAFSGYKLQYNKGQGPDFGVIDIRDYADSGSIAFKINAEGQNLDNAYVTIGYHDNLYDAAAVHSGWRTLNKITNLDDPQAIVDSIISDTAADGGTSSVTIDTWMSIADNGFREMKLIGVPIKEYYNAATPDADGYRDVIVPIADITSNPSFCHWTSMYNKLATVKTAFEYNNDFNPALVRAVGIARTDSGAAVEFAPTITQFTIVSAEPARHFEADVSEAENTISFSWLPAANTEGTTVSRLVRRDGSGNEVVLVSDAASVTSYTDTINTDSSYYDYYVETTINVNSVSGKTPYAASAKSGVFTYTPETPTVNQNTYAEGRYLMAETVGDYTWSVDNSFASAFLGGIRVNKAVNDAKIIWKLINAQETRFSKMSLGSVFEGQAKVGLIIRNAPVGMSAEIAMYEEVQ